MNMANYIIIILYIIIYYYYIIILYITVFFLFQLVDLHVYIVPPEIWRERYNNFLNQNVTETISAGIIRSVSKVNVRGHSQHTRSQDVIGQMSKVIYSNTRQ